MNLALLVLLAGTIHAQSVIDGRWWKQATPEMRAGVVNGLSDCLIWDKGEKLPEMALIDRAKKVDDYYRHHSARTPVADVLRVLPPDRSVPRPGGEHFREKHGIFDGVYFESQGIPPDEQKGFVLGYVACRTGKTPAQAGLSGTVGKIDHWYESHPKSAETKVADVLEKIGVVRK